MYFLLPQELWNDDVSWFYLISLPFSFTDGVLYWNLLGSTSSRYQPQAEVWRLHSILIIIEYELQYPLRSLLRKTFFQKFLNFPFNIKINFDGHL